MMLVMALVPSPASVAWISEPGARVPAPALIQGGVEDAPARGKFLIASRQLVEPTFARRVVLLLEHGSQGGIGLIVNRPTGVPLTRVVPGLEGLRGRDERVRSGGPVERNRLFMLMRADGRPPGTEQILPDTFGSSSLDPLRALIASGEAESAHFVVYAGYAGWAPGQLEAEIERGDWHVAAGRSEYVFDIDPAEVWPRLIRYHGGQWVERSRPESGPVRFASRSLPARGRWWPALRAHGPPKDGVPGALALRAPRTPAPYAPYAPYRRAKR